MNTFKTITLGTVLAAALGACAAPGAGSAPPIDERILASRLIPGATTRTEILAAFGSASVVKFDSGYEVWIYRDRAGAPRLLRYVPVVGLGAGLIPDRKRELVILFGPDGVVRKSRLLVLNAER